MGKMSLLSYIRGDVKHLIKMLPVFEKLNHQHVLSTVSLNNGFIAKPADEQLIIAFFFEMAFTYN